MFLRMAPLGLLLGLLQLGCLFAVAGGQSTANGWNSLYSGKDGYTPYTSNDDLYGLSGTSGGTTQTCSGCLTEKRPLVCAPVLNCTGSSLHLYQQSFGELNHTSMINPQSVTSIKIKYNSHLDTIYDRDGTGAFDELANLQTLIIQFTSVKDFPDVSNTQVGVLDLASNNINFYTTNWNQDLNLPQSLTYVSLRENSIHWVPDGAFADTNIRILSFSNNALFEFPGRLENMMSLLYLGLDGNQIKAISRNNLYALQNSPIQHLNLHSNDINVIEQLAFIKLDHLTILELQHNSLGLNTLPTRTLHDLPALLHLDLRYNGIQELVIESITHMPKLLRLKLDNNGLHTIAYNAFKNISDSLEILYINSNSLTTFPHQVLSQEVYPNLETIHAEHNQISNVVEFGRAAFPLHMTRLYDLLNTSYVRFSTTKNVKTLYLNNNHITQLGSTDLCEMSVLETLYLDSNFLTEDTIDSDTFQCLTQLQTLGLNSNQFHYVPEAVKYKDYLPSIRYLRMGSNFITFISEHTFSELDTLQTLYLRSNCILSIEDESFPYQSLTSLDLAYNKFRFLHKHPFANLTVLFTLNLQYNDITVIPDDAFHNSTSLGSLNLVGNNIKRILKTHFEDNPLTQGIFLQNNDIAFIEDGTFDHITATLSVQIQNNFLSKLPLGGSFQDLTVTDFQAYGNYITSLPTGTFSHFSSHDVSLTSNKISHIYPGAFNHVSTRYLYLSGNPLKYLYAYSFNHTSHSGISMSPLGAKTIPSFAFNDVSVSNSISLANSVVETIETAAFNGVNAQSISLSSSQLTAIEEEAFSDVSLSHHLSLTNNRLTQFSGSIFGGSCYIGEWLRLDNNELTSLPDDAFSGAYIDYIDLSDNYLVEYPSLALAKSGLRIIDLRNNQIAELPLGSFTSASSSLQSLYLDNNNIKVLAEDLFSDLGSLQTLYLQNNEISSVQTGAFSGLYSLENLYMGNNFIQFLPSIPLRRLEVLSLANNAIESIEFEAFLIAEKLTTLALGGNPLACDCYLFDTLEIVASAITSGSCSTPQTAANHLVHFNRAQTTVPTYFLTNATTYFQCSGINLSAAASKEYEITISFDAPVSQFPVVDGSNITATTTTPSPGSVNTSASPGSVNASARTYTVECTSDTATSLREDIVDTTATRTSIKVLFNQTDGVDAGVTYTCRVALTVNGSYTSAKSYPVFVTSLTALNTTFDTEPGDYVLDAVYYDFSISHADFYKVTRIPDESVTYMKSPYGNWLSQSDFLLSSSMADWFRSVAGTNIQIAGNIVLEYNATSGKHRYWNSNYFPLDTLGYKHENQRDCYSIYHNFGFTSVVKGGMIYQGQGTVSIAGGEQIWLAINKTVVLDVHVQPTDDEAPCKMVNLTPAAQTGGGWVIPMAGTINPISGDCNINSSLDNDKVWLQLEIGNSYHFEVFHAERKPCQSQLFIETSSLEFYQDSRNITGEPATDYFSYASEDFHVNGILREAELNDHFSTGLPFEINLLKGNEARHFTLKENNSVNIGLGEAPSAITYNYTYFPAVDTPFVECESILKVPEPEVSGTENFIINSESALLTLETVLDREVKDRYVLSMEVIDSSTSPVRTGSIVILVQVQDVNDNCPVITPAYISLEPIPPLQVEPLFYVNTTDEDINQNGEVYYRAVYDVADPPLDVQYSISMDYFTMVYNETSELILHLAFLDRGTDPVRGTIMKARVTMSNSCLLTVLFNHIDNAVEYNETTGGVHFKIPSYWIHTYECRDITGISTGWIKDSQMSASSSLDITSLPARARLNTTYDATGELFGGWVAATNNATEYWSIDFLEPFHVQEVLLQGRQDADMWVESFKLLYENSTGGYVEYTDQSGTTVFTGTFDQNSIVTTLLDPAIVTQKLRINPQTWHNSIALRVEIVGCSVADYKFYNTRCERCPAGSYCIGDGSFLPCGSCDSTPCSGNVTEHSFGGFETCAACPEGWLCHDGLASPCPLYHYAVCANNSCEESCRPCPVGSACSGGVLTVCRPGYYAEALSLNCSLCAAGTYQNASGQGECLSCPAGYESSSAMDHCNPCPQGTYSSGDGQICRPCLNTSSCACESDTSPCFVKDENLKVECLNTAYDGLSFECAPCPPGFTGDGSICLDIDECTDYSPCFNGRCLNLEPGYQCLACPYGYTGNFKDGSSATLLNRVFLCDGHTNASDVLVEQICEDNDECSTNNGGCDLHAYCYNSMGSFECGPCFQGYLGSSFYGCHIDNYCVSGNNSCSEDATCIYAGPGAYRCECKDGYTGTGFECGVDSDLDGHPDQSLTSCVGLRCVRDNCPSVPNSGQEDNDDENLGDNCDADDDNDVVTDELDNCMYVYNPWKTDTDGDGIGDDCDNCVSVNNTDQTDTDGNSVGDECDSDMDGDGDLNAADNCPLISNADQADSDSDGFGDACDNCPEDVNADQLDTDENGYGDACVPVSTASTDRDGDGIPDSLDNCVLFANPQQSDVDNDGKGDDCDDDTDGDGILNGHDNCVLVSNPGQEDNDANAVGNACSMDTDGDGSPDTEDHCPHNPLINNTSFSPFHIVYLDTSMIDQNTVTPKFRVNHYGKEVLMTQSTDVPFVLLGEPFYSDVEYSGTWYVNGNAGKNYIGFVFGYQSNRKYYVVMMRHDNKNRDQCIAAIKGLQIKIGTAWAHILLSKLDYQVVDSSTGPGDAMGDAVWHTDHTTNQVKLLWQDPEMYTWQHMQPIRWHLVWQPSIGLINVRVVDSEGVEIINSGDLYDTTIQGGRLGVFAFNQSDIYWSHLTAKCSEPQNWALQLDGVQDYVQLANISEYNIHESFTLEVWVKRNDIAIPEKQPIVCMSDSSICLYLQDDKVVGKLGQASANGTTVLSADYWHHITLRYEFETETINVYINGTGSGLEASATDAVGLNMTNINDTALYLGTDGEVYFEGIIDEVRIYNRWVPDTYLETYITSFSPEWTSHQGHITGHYTMNAYNPWDRAVVQDSGVYGLDGQAFGKPLYVQDTLNFAVFELAHPNN